MKWFGAMCLLWIYRVNDDPWLLTSVGLAEACTNISYIYKMNFHAIHFNITINLYWAPPTLYTCIVLRDIRNNCLNMLNDIVYCLQNA